MSHVTPMLHIPTLEAKLKAVKVIYEAGMTWGGRPKAQAEHEMVELQAEDRADQACLYLDTPGRIYFTRLGNIDEPFTMCNSARHFVGYIKAHS